MRTLGKRIAINERGACVPDPFNYIYDNFSRGECGELARTFLLRLFPEHKDLVYATLLHESRAKGFADSVAEDALTSFLRLPYIVNRLWNLPIAKTGDLSRRILGPEVEIDMVDGNLSKPQRDVSESDNLHYALIAEVNPAPTEDWDMFFGLIKEIKDEFDRVNNVFPDIFYSLHLNLQGNMLGVQPLRGTVSQDIQEGKDLLNEQMILFALAQNSYARSDYIIRKSSIAFPVEVKRNYRLPQSDPAMRYEFRLLGLSANFDPCLCQSWAEWMDTVVRTQDSAASIQMLTDINARMDSLVRECFQVPHDISPGGEALTKWIVSNYKDQKGLYDQRQQQLKASFAQLFSSDDSFP